MGILSSMRSALITGFLALACATGCAPDDGDGEEFTSQRAALDPSPACTGKPGAIRGMKRASVQVGFDQRTFIYYAPKNLDPNKPAPLVIVPHGFTMSGETMYGGTGWDKIADREGLIAIFPDGKGVFPWNVGSGVNGFGSFVAGGHDDKSFIDALIAYTEQDQCVDKNHMFMTGFSMGGYFANEVGCTRDDFAAIGPHSGGSHDLTLCPGKKKPVIIFHGDTDPLILYENALETRDRWVKRNGCSTAIDKTPVFGGTCEYNRNCQGGQVALCHFDLMGHAWAGGNFLGNIYSDPTKESASELGWKFFKKYAW